MMAADLPMQDVRAQYAELKATLSTFQASVGDCLERAEAEFLQAYRAHMVEVHRELQQLRAQLGSAEASLRDDDGVRELEASGAWYRDEAAQQAAHVAALRKDRTYARRKRRAPRRDGPGEQAPQVCDRLHPRAVALAGDGATRVRADLAQGALAWHQARVDHGAGAQRAPRRDDAARASRA